MNRFVRRVIWATVIVGPLILIGLLVTFWLSIRPGSLREWVARVQRPGYSLIYSTETPDHSYFALFDAGGDRMAFCYLTKRRPGVSTTSVTSITSADGEDALDTEHRKFTSLTRKILGVYGVIDGAELPIKPGVRGNLRVRYAEDNSEVLNAEIPWRQDAQRKPEFTPDAVTNPTRQR
jgi:hypothetical protein